jgi:glycosyltransferase involved in cell wall biosynthesis
VNPWDYDTIVYTIGNSTFHLFTYDIARRFPGVVWLHDVNLVGLHIERAKYLAAWDFQNLADLTRPPRTAIDAMRHELELAYGHRASTTLMNSETLVYQDFVDRGALLVATAARSARHLIVNSQVARHMVELDLGPGGRLPPCTVSPLAVPAAAQLQASPPPPNEGAPLVVSLGIVDRKKRPADLIRAVGALPYPVELVFVGDCGSGLRSELEQLAADVGISSHVHFTGFVEPAEYGAWLARASCAVQLRSVNFGESSAAVTDAIAAALPVVTSVASCAEMPKDVVDFVDAHAPVELLTARIDAVLRDAALRARMVAAQATYAADRSFSRVAQELADVIRTTVRAAARK